MTTKTLAATCALLMMASTPAMADDWLKVETDHFIIHSNDGAGQTRNYARELENFHYTLGQLYKAKNSEEKIGPQFELFLLKRREDMKQVWPTVDETVAGFYSHCNEGAIAYSATDLRDEAGGNFMRTVADRPDGFKTDMEVLYHEYAHHFMFAHYSTPYPAWFVEGFAEYFKTTRFDGNRVSIGYVSPSRYTTLFTSNWFDYSDILRGTARRETANDSFKFYAQSWLLAHYILTSQERVKAFKAYVTDYNAGKDPIVAFEAHMGVKPSELQKTLKDYLSKGTPVISFTFDDIPDPSLNLTRLPKSANKMLLWQSALKVCPRKDYRASLLENISTEYKLYPTDRLAQLTYARAEIQLGDPRLAEPILTKILAEEPANAEAQYLTGRLYFALASTAGND
ncbi:hypothetical protein OVA03_01180 [Asticcacaulis sp. SL142]|uniref:tetratricopeptide repeat protein n=1 Tax=Asticcacaulis sp. SL142 TaxID=2995155 RepID=UPI00226C8B67|nr:hypothetical protein [Asticcacaulis sp. SL142]WAC48578.1 hypothetical protein OVA03_01180 [Asticcacaulis sp. SL142]